MVRMGAARDHQMMAPVVHAARHDPDEAQTRQLGQVRGWSLDRHGRPTLDLCRSKLPATDVVHRGGVGEHHGPAIVATMICSFIQAMTEFSGVIFLVTAPYNLATACVVGRVEHGEYLLAIAHCTLMIAFMLMVIWAVRLVVGEQNLICRAARPAGPSASMARRSHLTSATC